MRLHEGLVAKGVDSTFLCAVAKNSFSSVEVVHLGDHSILKRVLLRLGYTGIDKVEQSKKEIRSCKGDYEYYSLPFSNYRLEENELITRADILNFHWVSNFVDFPTFFRIKKPIVWTLHDMNPLLGGFHYGEDLLKNETNQELMHIERKFQKIKSEAIAGANLTVCSPSRWLHDASLAHPVMGQKPHHHIPYGLNTTIFRPYPQAIARQIFNLPREKKIIVFASANIGNKRKGFHLLKEAIARIPPEEDFLVVAVGYNPNIPQEEKIVFLDPIHDEALLPLLFSAADFCAIPSIEDNLPNVMLESLCCGTPVLGFSIGGLKDVIVDGSNGFLCPTVSGEALAATITRALRSSFDRMAISKDSIEKFDASVQADRYIALYNSL